MKVDVVPIGNSRGIRIPKALIKLCHIQSEVDLDVKGDTIVIHPVKHKAREGWETAFRTMRRDRGDELLIDDRIDLQMDRWEW